VNNMKPQTDHELLLDCIKATEHVFIIGNGGSAANAIHIANDLLSCGVKAQALTADVATISAIANDFGYEYIFARQISVLGERGDLLIALSGSGESPNIIQGIETAILQDMLTLSITGDWQDNTASRLAHRSIRSGKNMQDAEDAQLQLVHKVYRVLKGLE